VRFALYIVRLGPMFFSEKDNSLLIIPSIPIELQEKTTALPVGSQRGKSFVNLILILYISKISVHPTLKNITHLSNFSGFLFTTIAYSINKQVAN